MTDTYKPIPKNILDDYKLTINGKIRPGSDRPPQLKLGVLFNNPRFTVFTNNDSDGSHQVYSANLNTLAFHTVMELLEKIITLNEPNSQYNLKNMTGRPGEQTHQSTIYVGMTEKRIIYIAIARPDNKPISFPLLNTDYHLLRDKDGAALPEAEISLITARAYLHQSRALIPATLVDSYVENKSY